MTRARTLAVSLLLLTFVAATAEASWYDDYDKGLDAARAGNWNAVVTHMTAAIKGNPKEANKAKTYGTIFINYKPYYYRGIAYVNVGKYEQAIADLEHTMGPGPDDMGAIVTHLDRAKARLAAANTPAPEPARPNPEPARPTPAVVQPSAPAPAVPSIDPALKQRASAALLSARQKLQAAQQRKAGNTPQYSQAMSMITEATSKNATARSNDDINAIISLAEGAADLADLAQAPTATPAPAIAATPQPAITPRPTAAANAVMADYTVPVRRALEYYFAGEFETAARQFERLSRDMPTNGWIRAFLGASYYSQYAFEADPKYREAALKAFREAKKLRRWNGGLPEKYFSKRIRKAFNDTAG
jgi:tetratricopeptide (TPR) repeat protein